MTCDPRLLSYYRDGALSFEERYELEDHLRECPDCTAELRGLMRLAQVVRSLPMEPVSPTLRQDFNRLLAERQAEQRRPVAVFSSIGRTLAPAAVAASIAVSALVVFRPGALDLPSKPTEVGHVVQAPADPPTTQAHAPVTVLARGGSVAAAPSAPQPEVAVQPKPSTPGNPVASLPKPGAPSGQSPFERVLGPENGSLPIKVSPPEPIARFYDGSAQVRDLLGAALPGSRTVTLLEQSFQGGLAIWRSDTREIYVLQRGSNTWSVHTDTWRPGDRISVDTAPPAGAMVPAAGFGTVWRSSPEIKSRLGWAVYEPRGSGGSIQAFEKGLIVWTPHGLIYVLSNDGKWRTYPDATPL